ncbi:hypothetical protein BLNAU_24549 [Blattamonas nauphoetae]|uniref:Uncharacterized protein n=1 Tax=Blattamonas nauphoetae TaxID=2049346 RepID=A0ABQ9WM34_9EUKA|nr:hypothetical protein BLNAU_24549 [Blattamonas nauphoetae]
MTNSKRSSVNQNERSPNLNRKDESAVQREDVSIRITVTQRKKELMRIALNRRVEELSQTIEQIKADNIIVTFDPTCFIMKSATVTRINTQEHAGCFTKPVLKGIHRMSLKIEDVIVLMGVIDATKYHNHLTTFVYTSPNAAMMNRNNGYLYGWPNHCSERRSSERAGVPHHFVNIPVPLVFALDVRTKKVPIPIATIGERRRNARVGHVVSEHRAEQRGAGRVECGWDRSAVSVQHPFHSDHVCSSLLQHGESGRSSHHTAFVPFPHACRDEIDPSDWDAVRKRISRPSIFSGDLLESPSLTSVLWELSREMISIVRSVISAESTVDPTWLTMPQHLHHFIVAMEEFSEHCPSSLQSLHHPLFVCGFRNLVIEIFSNTTNSIVLMDVSSDPHRFTLRFLSPGHPDNNWILDEIVNSILAFDTSNPSNHNTSHLSLPNTHSPSHLNLADFTSFLVLSPLQIPCSLILKWFVELVLSLATGYHCKSRGVVLTKEDIVVDRSFSFHIQSTSTDSPLLLHPPSTFASDLRLLTSYFDDFLESLQSCDRLLPPPEFRNKDIWTIISLTCVRHLAQRGLLSCEGLTQQDLLQLIQNQLLSHLHSLTINDSSFFPRNRIDKDGVSLYLVNPPLAVIFKHDILPFIHAFNLTLHSESSAKEALMPVFHRLMEIGEVLQRSSGSVEWRWFLQFVEDLADGKIVYSDLMFLSDDVFMSPLREILEEMQNQVVNTPNSESDRSWTHSNVSSSLSLSRSGSSVPFDADQRFFTSVNERPPSPPNSALSFFGSESGNEMRTVSNSELTDTGTSQWTNTTQLSSKERLFVVETIHTILSKQPNSDRTPSTLASRPSPNPPLQPLSHSPLFFSSSIFDLDDTSLTACLGQLAQLAQQDQTSNHFELSQQFVDGLVSCLGSSNTILSNCAHLVLTRKLPLFFPFVQSHIASLAKTLSDRTYDERSLVIQVTGWAIQEGIETIRLSETFIHQICKPYIVDPLTFFDAVRILTDPNPFPSFRPHSPSLVQSFETFVDTSIDLASFLWKEYASKDTPDHFLRNACLSLFVYHAFASSRRNNRTCPEKVVELLFRPDLIAFDLLFLHYSPILFVQTFPFELMIERNMRSCQFFDVQRGLLYWAQLVTRHPYPLRDLFSTLHPFFLRGFHQILLSPPSHSSPDWNETSEWNTAGQDLFLIFARSRADSLLPDLFPVENLLTLRAQILSANRWSDHLIVNDLNVITFSSFTPFGECPALRSLFSILCQPGVTSNGHVNLELLEHVSIVSSHSLPLHFDSPLLAFVRTVHPLTHASHEDYTNELNSQQSLLNLHHAPRFVLKWLHPFHLMTTLKNLLSLSPVQVSLALLTLSRAVDDSSKACEWLVRAGAVDVVVEKRGNPTTGRTFIHPFGNNCPRRLFVHPVDQKCIRKSEMRKVILAIVAEEGFSDVKSAKEHSTNEALGHPVISTFPNPSTRTSSQSNSMNSSQLETSNSITPFASHFEVTYEENAIMFSCSTGGVVDISHANGKKRVKFYEGSPLNDAATRQACALLKSLTPQYASFITEDHILKDLVPTSNGSCAGNACEATQLIVFDSYREFLPALFRLIRTPINQPTTERSTENCVLIFLTEFLI